MHHRAQLGAFLNERQLVGVAVQVGADQLCTRQILGGWHGRKLFVVDPLGQWPSAVAINEQRLDVVRASESDAAGGFEDGSIDFAYLGASTTSAETTRSLALWYPKLRVGGVMSGHGYADVVWRDVHYQAKRAVDEFAAEHGLQVRVTFDTPPVWFFPKPSPGRAVARTDVALLTAHDANQRDFALISTPNKAAYCARHGYRFVERTDGFAPSRPPAWSKIRFVKECLKEHEWVFWSDADSLVMNGSYPLEDFIDPEYDVILPHDDFGQGVYNVNTGHMFFRRGKWSMRFLEEVWQQRQFLRDRLWENRAVIHLLWNNDYSGHVQLASQRRFNSYPGNYRRGDFIVHVAGMPDPDRLKLMRHYSRLAEL